MATPAQRQHMAAIMRLLLANEPRVHYSQRRPMTTAKLREQQMVDMFAGGGAITTDCSETITMICRMGGLADPNGLGYNGLGWTGTMLSNLPHYSDPSDADLGALVVFDHGAGTGDHVAQVLTPGADPWLFSHGSESGPKRLRLSTELAAQRRVHGPASHAIFLSIADL